MKIIFMTGTFDIMHKGHVEILQFAKKQGDKLIIAIDSDERVKKLKGKNRPFNNLEDRIFFIKAFKYVDLVYSFNDDLELINLIKKINPDIVICGSDWKNKKYVGEEYIKKIIYFDRVEPYSTTKILSVNKHE